MVEDRSEPTSADGSAACETSCESRNAVFVRIVTEGSEYPGCGELSVSNLLVDKGETTHPEGTGSKTTTRRARRSARRPRPNA